MTLYEINAKIEEVLNSMLEEVDEETGEVNADIAAELAELNIAREEKLDNIGVFIKNLESEAEAINNEINTLRIRAKRRSDRAKWLREYVANDLLGHEQKKFSTSRVEYSFIKSKSVEVNEALLPKKFFRKKIEISPDKVEIKKHLNNGEKIKGATLIEKQNLQVR